MFIQLRNIFIKKSEIAMAEKRFYDRKGTYYVVYLKNGKEIDINDQTDIDILVNHLSDRVK